MFSFFSNKKGGDYAFLIDIGSGSVGMAIVDRRASTEASDACIWSQREFTRISTETDLAERLKRVAGALMNSFLTAGATGYKALREHDQSGQVGLIAVNISAPWSYTITQTIEYEQTTPFSVTDKLIASLADSASEQIIQSPQATSVFKSIETSILRTRIQGAIVNDYLLTTFDGSVKTDTLSLLHTTTLAPNVLINTLTDGIDKVMPHREIDMSSFMFRWFVSTKRKIPSIQEFALIDVTSEATELGIISGGALMSTANTPFGSYTMAREIANQTKLTLEEAHSLLRMDAAEVRQQPNTVQAARTAIETAYATHITDMIERAHEDTVLPHTVYVMGDSELLPFLVAALALTAKATQITFSAHPVTDQYFSRNISGDPALSLLAEAVLHT